MTGRTEVRVREIRSRTRRYRRRCENRQLSGLTALSVCLFVAIGAVFGSVQSPGIADVADGYGAVLLRNGAGAYVVIGIVAFVVGVSATVLCIRLKNKSKPHSECAEEREETL